MATQKLKPTTDDTTFKTPEPTGEAPEALKPMALEVTYHVDKVEAAPPQLIGQHALTDDEIRRVNTVKQLFAETITYLKTLRDSQHDAEITRCFSIAITEAEAASMWAVKGITWRG